MKNTQAVNNRNTSRPLKKEQGLKFSTLIRHYTSFFLPIMIFPAALAFSQSADIEEIQGLVERWITVEKQETALVTDWQQQQQIMEQHLLLLREEEAQLTRMVSSNTSAMDDVTQRRLSLLELQNSMESDQQKLEQTLKVALSAINELHGQLPPPLEKSWQQRLNILSTETESNPDTSSNQQLQALLELLTQLEDFQQRISLNEDTIITPEGSEVLVKQIYLGASHGWYVSADGLYSGYGQTGPQGWVWLDSPSVDSETVQQAITMLERNVDVELIKLPLILQSPPLTTSIGGAQ